MNIRPRAEEIRDLTIRSFPQLRPVSQALFLAVGMLVPATDRRGLGAAKERRPVSNEETPSDEPTIGANREQELARNKAYRAANLEKIRTTQTAYREANREKLKADQQAYYAANREKRRAQMVAYRAARRAASKQPQ
jgi:hypothetical protein